MFEFQIDPSEYHPFYRPYIEKSSERSLLGGLRTSMLTCIQFWEDIPEHKLEYRYAEGKWTIKEIILHLIDSERIFAYRALRFARKDLTPLSAFEENDYVPVSNANSRSLEDLIDEYQLQRKSTIKLFSSFTDEMLLSRGIANEAEMSVRAIGFVMQGHERHHCKVIEERYLG